jgi:hypothetical protein
MLWNARFGGIIHQTGLVMRVAVCVVAFVVLLLAGFLATPGIFKVVNPEYLLALRENAEPLERLSSESADIDGKIVAVRLKISNLEGDVKRLSTEQAAKQATAATQGLSPAQISQIGIDYALLASAVARQIEQAEAEKKILDERKIVISVEQSERRKKLEVSEADTANIYLVTRALALGAVGALMSIFAKFLFLPNIQSPFEDRAFLGRMWASMALGGIVAVVVVGLFLTGFISIFSNSTQNTGPTDFWKVTILCLFAGAFSDRLFQTASERMGSYLQTVGTASKAPPSGKLSAAKSKRRNRTR